MAEFARSDIPTPLDPLVRSEPSLSEENFLPAAWSSLQVDGESWGVPLDLHGWITYDNEDLLEKYDAEHMLDDGIVAVDELLTLEGRLDDGHDAIPPAFLPALVQAWQYNVGGGVAAAADDDDDDGTVDMTGPGYRAAFEALTALEEAGLIALPMIPTTLLVVFAQRYVVSSLSLTAGIKG